MPAARLIYATSEAEADLLYATDFFAPDPFLWWESNGVTSGVFTPLEIDRARRTAKVDRVFCTDDFFSRGAKRRPPVELIARAAARDRLRSFETPDSFPLGLADALRKRGFRVRAARGAFFPERTRKSDEEITKIEAALRLAEAGLNRGIEVLRQSKPGKDRMLRWAGSVLTSERLRGEIDAEVMRRGGLPAGTIVAGGEQACDPHERGSGPLPAHSLLIIDVFPRDQRTGYFGDLTRTVVRGQPSEAMRKLYATVQEGKAWVTSQVKAGADGAQLHYKLVERFRQAGYPTEVQNGRHVGFFHGTGHSLGLEIHEAPRFSAGKFKARCLMTIEPGLYYPGLGGVRLEDLVVIGRQGVRNLTIVPEVLQI
jgi:Xaa-Pro aminopeptidase